MFVRTYNFKYKPEQSRVWPGQHLKHITFTYSSLTDLFIPKLWCLWRFGESPCLSAGNPLKHMDILKGSVWQIVVGEMLTCGKVLALAPAGSRCAVSVVGSEAFDSEGGQRACELRRGCFPTAYKLPAKINAIFHYRSFKIGSFPLIPLALCFITVLRWKLTNSWIFNLVWQGAVISSRRWHLCPVLCGRLVWIYWLVLVTQTVWREEGFLLQRHLFADLYRLHFSQCSPVYSPAFWFSARLCSNY